MKILIVKRDKIGDMLLLTPMLEHLAKSRPHFSISVLANDYNHWVLKDNPFIDRIFVYPRARHDGKLRLSAVFAELLLTLKLRKERFDVVISAGGVFSPRALLRACRLGGKRVVGFVRSLEFRVKGLTDPIFLPDHVHEAEANYMLLEPLGIKAPGYRIEPLLVLHDRWKKKADIWRSRNNLGDYVVIGINSRRDKRKPSDAQIIRWARHLHDKWRIKTVLVWQPGAKDSALYPGDDDRVSELVQNLPDYVIPFKSRESIFDALGIIWGAKVTVMPDGGISHLASVSPGGVIALFADTTVSPHPDNWRPYSEKSTYLEARLSVEELPDSLVLQEIEKRIHQN